MGPIDPVYMGSYDQVHYHNNGFCYGQNTIVGLIPMHINYSLSGESAIGAEKKGQYEGVCVCVCVCEREYERERVCE